MNSGDQIVHHFLTNSRFKKGKGFGYYHCAPDWEWIPPAFRHYDLWYIVSGKGKLHLNGSTYILQKGMTFVMQPGDRANAEQDLNDRLTVIYLHFQVQSETTAAIKLQSRYTVQDTYPFESNLLRLLELCEGNQPWKEEEFDLLLKLVLLALFRLHYDQGENAIAGKHNRMMRKLLVHIRNHPVEYVTSQEITTLTGLSPRYAGKLFRNYTGVSLQQYAIRVKLEKASHLLTETNMNISQVAAALGYSSSYFFSRQFKKEYGVSPASFIKKG